MGTDLTAGGILHDLIARSPWVNPATTVDTVKHGRPDKPVRRVAVCWYPALATLQEAASLGCDAVFTHEPLWWEHFDKPGGFQQQKPGLPRWRLLEESGMTVIRLHDTWDNWPVIGIRDSFARGLGLSQFIAEDQTRWHAVYELPRPQKLRDFARDIAQRVQPLGQDGVEVMGNPDMLVHRPAIGVGCGHPREDMIAQGSDVLIVCYDGAWYWRDRQRFAEQGVGVIAMEHGTTEMWGLEAMAEYLRHTYASLEVHYLQSHEKPWHVGA